MNQQTESERCNPVNVRFVGGPLDGKIFPFADVGYNARYDTKQGYYFWDRTTLLECWNRGAKTAIMRFSKFQVKKSDDE